MGQEVLLYTDEAMIEHDPGRGHPERPERLKSLASMLEQEPLEGTRMLRPKAASAEAIARVHDGDYIARLSELEGQRTRLDADTALSEGSIPAAFLAVGAGIDAVDALLTNEAKRAFVLVRPPGHHAEHKQAMGFCLFNNIAVAAAHARAKGAERVMIVDWDVHHGNGSQHAFYDRSDVLVFNSHQFPFYPGTGSLREQGEDDGLGYTVNVPLPPGMTDGDYRCVFSELLRPIATSFAPDLILVSAGFDAHRADPLASMELSEEGYAGLCGVVQELADELCQGRMACFLEGGYDLDALCRSVRACLEVMTGASPPDEDQIEPSARGWRAFKEARGAYKERWKLS